MHAPGYPRPSGRYPLRTQRRGYAGFSLIELIVVVVITAILTMLAAPSFTSFIANQRAASVASELFGSLLTARSKAIALNANVTVSPKAGNWQNGWQVLDANNAVLDDRGIAAGATVTGPASVVYRASGRIQAAAAPSFVVTATSGGTSQCVSIDISGRPYMTSGTSC